MSIFLFFKPIADMLYRFRWMDYALVIMAIIAAIYQLCLVKPDIKKALVPMDVSVILLVLIFVFNCLIYRAIDYTDMVKILSAYLLYFIGRIYRDRIYECKGAIAKGCYLVVYANLIYRIYLVATHKIGFLEGARTSGLLYYNDMDLTYAMITAFVLITFMGRNSILKLLTIFIVIPYLTFCSTSGVHQMLLIADMGFLLIFILERMGAPRKITRAILGVGVSLLVVAIVIIIVQIFILGTSHIALWLDGNILDADNITYVYMRSSDEIIAFCQQSLLVRFFGTGILTAGAGLYTDVFVGLGYVGVMLMIALMICAVHELIKSYDIYATYVVVMLAVLFLGSGLYNHVMAFTMNSWYLMMFLGMLVTKNEH